MMIKIKLMMIYSEETKLIDALDGYAVDGLRTLMYAMRNLDEVLVS